MEDINLFIDWMMSIFMTLHNFFSKQHPIIQARVYLPIAVIVILLFINVAKNLFNGRSLG